jgi:predicted acylesterase/phospholipase RssA
MSKVNIQDLENIVLEGGGAKGAAYLGAIQALEEALKKYYADHPSDSLPNAKAILDYGNNVQGRFVPQVHQFAGSSAGAITCFALALGLDSKLIEDVTDYEFGNFLQDGDPGKYRMIDKKGTISIGEDRKSTLGKGDGKKEYKFDLHSAQKITASFLKSRFRKEVLSAVTKTIVSGAYDTLKGYVEMVQRWEQIIQSKGQVLLDDFPINVEGLAVFAFKAVYNWFSGTIGKFFPGMMPPVNNPQPQVWNPQESSSGPEKDALVRMAWEKGVPLLLKFGMKSLSKSSGMKIDMDAVGNLIWDRGMFSGFAVREFFCDLMIYACLHDTHFQRCYFQNENDRALLCDVKMNMKDGRLLADFSSLHSGLQRRLLDLPKLSFKEFYELTGITLILCVSNFSTDEPIYFSHIHTPEFPVAEAVGASMTIPPAIKPLYNESNVVVQSPSADGLYNLDPQDLGRRKGTNEDYFNFDQFHLDLVAIKRFLGLHNKVAIDTNNTLGISAHLLLLRDFLWEKRDSPSFTEEVKLENQVVVLTKDHFVFHYNAAYKGLLLDGGYRCNIPYNVFRESFWWKEGGNEILVDQSFAKTLALKLDDTFPKEWLHKIYGALAPTLQKMGNPKILLKEQRKVLGQMLKVHLKTLKTKADDASSSPLFENKDVIGLDAACFEHIAEAVVKLHEEMLTRYRNPWNKKKSILMTAMEGYGYGTEAGQVRFLSDHEHIVPLYSYGVGTYDFDLKKIMGLAKLSQNKAKERMEKYFLPGL